MQKFRGKQNVDNLYTCSIIAVDNGDGQQDQIGKQEDHGPLDPVDLRPAYDNALAARVQRGAQSGNHLALCDRLGAAGRALMERTGTWDVRLSNLLVSTAFLRS